MQSVKTTVLTLIKRRDIWLCLACALFFQLFWQVDLWVAEQFYQDGNFPLNKHPLVAAVYRLFANIHFVYLALLIVALICLAPFKRPQAKHWRRGTRYLLLVLLFVPGLAVNVGLKDNSFGRPRPVHLEQFGGNAQFAPAFSYSGQCNKNCSFVSGHAAIGFYAMALGWLFASRPFFIGGMLLGIGVGAVRIVQGGHFLSDVIFSFWVVYFGSLLCAKLYHLSINSKDRWLFHGKMQPN